MNAVLPWVVFFAFVAVMLVLDLRVFHRNPHEIRMREALLTSGLWVGLALAFGIGVLVWRGPHVALEYFTCYVIEESLSIDNLFVFMLIFAYFRVPPPYQHRVLFWGIVGAVVMRLLFIVAGITLIRYFSWVMYVFGGILIVSGIRLWNPHAAEVHPEKNLVIRWFRRIWPVTPDYHEGRFFTRIDGRRWATPLVVVLLMVESTDLIFAVDSIPAVLAITRDPFIVFSSNVFAVLGLRSIYFALAELLRLFHYLHYGLAMILVFVGLKMVLEDFVHIPILVALAVIAVVLAACVVLSLWRARPPAPAQTDDA